MTWDSSRNPHIAKAEAAEAKAKEATDVASEVRAYLEAARLWDRAAAKEEAGKWQTEYEANAQAAREHADAAEQGSPPSVADLKARLDVARGGKDEGE